MSPLKKVPSTREEEIRAQVKRGKDLRRKWVSDLYAERARIDQAIRAARRLTY